ncbi:hypothetical protein EDF57_101892 [Novosphingobium sp. PhB55]|uniref:hypothetical protein n=1 Tax=Novosphingobium sp. PhB55 TaxID=2485106 RepID=UPI00106517A2|nr:hypothetical protein [Novosphingobium sp. PhB55]TDW68998.1 hypothetical protein EDF57_101892 [Novosphingobium sp. PhB55]
MFGLILKSNLSEDPVTVSIKCDRDDFADGMDVDPDAVATTWPKGGFTNVRDMNVRSTATHRSRAAIVASRP